MKTTDRAIAKRFDTTPQTLIRWKKGSFEYKGRYLALKEFFIKEQLLIQGSK
tara:strand:- start:949 stop:1104 length:156 start_codon:yes stop_codon:yes gene_type:complete